MKPPAGIDGPPVPKTEMKSMKLKTPFAAALVLCAMLSPAFAGEKLNQSELKRLAPGRYAVNVMGLVNMTVTLRPNGGIVGQAKDTKDTGSWFVQGEKFCIAWNKWLNGSARCTSLTGNNGSYSGGGLSIRKI